MPFSPPRVLVVEDDLALRGAMTAALRASDYIVEAASDGRDIERTIDSFRPDAAIIDIGLPNGPDGFDIAAMLRAKSEIPLIFATAADQLDDRLRGFGLGADDYLVKPFAVAELLARLRAVLRRTGRLSSATWEVFDIVLDESNRIVHRRGQQVDLTKTEFDLLAVLMRSPGSVFSKAQLLSLVWGFDQYAPNLVEVHISALRRKLEALGPRVVHTERGEGYVLRT